MSWSKNDRSRTGKLVHNLTVQELAESTLQFGRGYYAQNYAAWNTHLAYSCPRGRSAGEHRPSGVDDAAPCGNRV